MFRQFCSISVTQVPPDLSKCEWKTVARAAVGFFFAFEQGVERVCQEFWTNSIPANLKAKKKCVIDLNGELEEFQWATTCCYFFWRNPLRGCRMKVFFWGGAFHQGFTTALPGVFGSFQRVVCMRVMCGWVELMPRRASQGEKQWPKKHGRWYITHLYRDSVSLSHGCTLKKSLAGWCGVSLQSTWLDRVGWDGLEYQLHFACDSFLVAKKTRFTE